MKEKIKDRKMLRTRANDIEIETEEGEKFLEQKYEGHSETW